MVNGMNKYTHAKIFLGLGSILGNDLACLSHHQVIIYIAFL